MSSNKPPLEQIVEHLRNASQDKQADALVAITQVMAKKVGLDWDMFLASRARAVAKHQAAGPLPDTPWEPLEVVDDDAMWARYMPHVRCYPGFHRRYKGKRLVVRQRGASKSGMGSMLPCGWYATIEGELVDDPVFGVFFHHAEDAISAAEALVDEMMENA